MGGESNQQANDASGADKIVVLMVDDQALMGEAVRRMLAEDPAVEFHFCQEPRQAMQMAAKVCPTVILQDLVLPQVDGLTMVKFFRANPATRDVPLVVLSSREQADVKVQAFALGANDYMVKFPDKLEVVARIRYHSRAYRNLVEREKAYQALAASQAALHAELQEAVRYVESLLPAPIATPAMRSDWAFRSSTALGGDAFGHHWIDDNHFALYLLDVCGHGVGAALLSVSAINVLREQTLKDVDFCDPAAVLSSLNESFNMDRHNQMYFTIWYGVWQPSCRTLKFASGGHPPAILIDPSKDCVPQRLATPNMMVGAMPGTRFESSCAVAGVGARLYLFSDGVYEVDRADGSGLLTIEELADELRKPAASGTSKVHQILDWVKQVQGKECLDDDFSLLELVLN